VCPGTRDVSAVSADADGRNMRIDKWLAYPQHCANQHDYMEAYTA